MKNLFNINTADGTIILNYDPNQYRTRAGAAKAFHKALSEYCRDVGWEEPILRTPEEYAAHGYSKCWNVSWESGPYEWAIGASWSVTGPWGYTEPHYSFDLCFVY